MDSIGAVLARDHETCDQLFAQGCADVRLNDWDAATSSIAALAAELERHLRAEEDVVFDAFDAALNTPAQPTLALRAEHRRIQAMLKRRGESLIERDPSTYFKHAASLRILLQQHHEKEERAFYPTAERILAAQMHALVNALRTVAPILRLERHSPMIAG